jgi:alpha-aminoadipate carrier protein LysW
MGKSCRYSRPQRSIGVFVYTTGKFIPERTDTMSFEAECPECAADIAMAGDTIVGEIIQCPECGAELEVMALNPPRLELAPEEEEDWGE